MIKYCTTDLTKWGAGLERLLHDFEVDDNFFDFESQLAALNDHLSSAVVSISSITLTPPNQLYVHLTDSTILGPFTIPVWTPTNVGPFAPSSISVAGDFVTFNGSVYLVLQNYTTGPTFDPGATDGMGHNIYALWWTTPGDVLPLGGDVGDNLTVTVAGGAGPPSVAWQAPAGISTVRTRSDHTFVPGLADANTYNRMTNFDGCAVVIPNDADVGFSIGTEMHFRQANDSDNPVTFEAATPAVINPVDGLLNQTAGNGATITLKKVDDDAWDIFGRQAVHS